MIITCPYCLIKGERKNLAEVDINGIKIIRNNNGMIDFTIVKSNEFTLVCGNCGNSVYYQENKEVSVPFDITLSWGTIFSYYAKSSHNRI